MHSNNQDVKHTRCFSASSQHSRGASGVALRRTSSAPNRSRGEFEAANVEYYGDEACAQYEEVKAEAGDAVTDTSDEPFPATYHETIAEAVQRCLATRISLNDPEIADCYSRASEQPPITSESLAELDMQRIINNPKLRHDVNFDRELHFRPNLDGSKGREKIKQAEEYWKGLQGELSMYQLVLEKLSQTPSAEYVEYWENMREESEKRLPGVFNAIRDILQTLVPDYDQPSVRDRLDTELVMREIKHGVCDLLDLADWLARILKNHCAPMRDTMVDRMKDELKRGALEGKADVLVNGVRQLLSILEAMKLDVANHQIRHMRPFLVEDTVNFQRKYNAHRISINRIDVPRSKNWLDTEIKELSLGGDAPSHLDALTSALIRGMLFGDTTTMHPQTFYLDSDRLRTLRIELHTSIYQKICRDILSEATIEASTSCNPTPSEFDTAAKVLRTSVAALLGTSGKVIERIENIAAEIMRIVLVMEGGIVKFDGALLDFVEHRLNEELQPLSVMFKKHALEIFEDLLPNVQASVQRHIRCSAIELLESLVPHTPPPPPPFGFGAILAPPPPVQLPNTQDDLVRRFTHMIVLHWQVWADLVYLRTEEEPSANPTTAPGDSDPSNPPDSGPSPPPSGSASPMMPVAEAVYAPGRKWLPMGVAIKEVPSGLPTPAASPAPTEAKPTTTSTHECNVANHECNHETAEGTSSEQAPHQQQAA